MSKKEINTDAKVEKTEASNDLKSELEELKKQLEDLKKLRFSPEEKAAIEIAREEMITDEEIGPCYIDPKYKEDGFFYRITDTTRPGKIQRMLNAGYEIVYHDNAKVGDNTVINSGSLTNAVMINLGGNDVNRPGVLMRIPTERYDKRQKAKAKRIREDSSALYQTMADQSDFGEITIGDTTFTKNLR